MQCHCGEPVHAKGECRKHYEKSLKLRNPAYAERQRANCRDWHSRNVAKVSTYHREYHQQKRAADPEGYKRRHTARRYGLTNEQYEAIVSQPCGLCGERDKVRYVDHCHATGIIRGALCHGCNLGLGFIDKRGIDWAERALAWMRRTDGGQ